MKKRISISLLALLLAVCTACGSSVGNVMPSGSSAPGDVSVASSAASV